jgi:hypothetical protein
MADRAAYRPLTDTEIRALEATGSTAEDWRRVRVAEAFRADAVRRSSFSGDVRLGAFREPVTVAGVAIPSGVRDARLADATVGDDALVERVGLLARTDVDAGAALLSCGAVLANAETAFGNGAEIEVWNEAGGRAIRMHERLTAQGAYLAAAWRHRPGVRDALDGHAAALADARRSDRSHVAAGARILRADVLRNVRIGPGAHLAAPAFLSEVTVLSDPGTPTVIGAGVHLETVIVHTGSVVDGAATLQHCFVGQGCRIGRQFSGENCVFFANAEAFHGEAVAMLAGPYTVTHHKSTLLIAGLTSFYNAGSGTNQSNHMYKLGPLHQGTLERGAKTGSFSYLLWPARVGPFTAVIGKHNRSFDVRNLPFSYITESGGRSLLSPGVNCFTVGTKRDGDKWPRRDRRPESDRLDRIRFDVLSPFTVGRLLAGRTELEDVYADASREEEFVTLGGLAAKRLLCRTAMKTYDLAARVYLGDCLLRRLEMGGDRPEALRATGGPGTGEWIDCLGLLAPQETIERLVLDLESGALGESGAFEARLDAIDADYAEAEWRWAHARLTERLGAPPETLDAGALAEAVRDWREARTKANKQILADAQKEFGAGSRIGFGPDGDETVRDLDFEAVRGTFDENPFVRQIGEETAAAAARAEALLAALEE